MVKIFGPNHIHSFFSKYVVVNFYHVSMKDTLKGDNFKTKTFKFLGQYIAESLSWQHHIILVHKQIISSIFAGAFFTKLATYDVIGAVFWPR